MKHYRRFTDDTTDGYQLDPAGSILEIDMLLDWTARVDKRLAACSQDSKVYKIMMRYKRELDYGIEALIRY